MSCESTRGLLALSAAGLLEPEEQRRVDTHVRECSDCAAELEALGAIAGALERQAAPHPPAGLVYRTQIQVAIEADRRQGARLALGASALGWLLALVTWV